MGRRFQVDPVALKAELDGQGLKRWWVAEFAGIHKTTLRRWLSGRIQYVDEARVSRLASLLGVIVEKVARVV